MVEFGDRRLPGISESLPAWEQRRLMAQAVGRFDLSERARRRILELARTTAALAGTDNVDAAHLSEALGFRVLDRQMEGS